MHISVDVHCVALSSVCGMVPCTSGIVVGKGLRLPHVNVNNLTVHFTYT